VTLAVLSDHPPMVETPPVAAPSDDRPVVVIGGGLAGLSAAAHLRRHGVPVRLYEGSPRLAGLARSEHDADGFTYDFGAHFITNRLAAAVGCSAHCRDMPRYGETVHLNGQNSSYPLGLMRRPRFLLSAATTRATAPLRRGRPQNAAQWYTRNYGHALAQEIAIPLTQAWAGVPAEQLAASVGEKFATSLPRSLMLKLASAITGRTVALGYSKTLAESPHVWHVYPEGGIGAVCDRLAEEVADAIVLRQPVQAIHVEGGRVVGVRVGGGDVPAAAVISTAPVHVLARLVRGSDRLAPLAGFRYRPMVFVNLRIDGASGLRDVVTWTPGQEFPFFRLSDIGLGLPWLVPAGKSQLTADIGCEVGDATWTMADENLGRLCMTALERILPGISHRYLGCRVMRTPLAYPIYHRDYEAERLRFEQSTGIAGLLSVGRNGEFAHLLMEDVYWMTKRKVSALIAAWTEAPSRSAAVV
jgi:oxygen-dependent protoporphyrinogen oxidase